MKQRDLWNEAADEMLDEWIAKIPMPLRNRVLPPSQAAEIMDEVEWLRKTNTSLINTVANLHTASKSKDEVVFRTVRGIKRAIEGGHASVAWMLCEAILSKKLEWSKED